MNENIDLIETFQKTNQSITRKLSSLKIQEEERGKREDFYHEDITLILENPYFSWTVPRFRITPNFVQSLIDKKLQNEGVKVLYLREMDGEGLVITTNDNRFNLLLKTPPTKYRIEVEFPSKTKDVLSSTSYFGDMKIIIFGIPKQSQSCLYYVHKEDIRRWLIESIISEDPNIILAEREIEDLTNTGKKISEMLQMFPDESFHSETDHSLKNTDATSRFKRRFTDIKNEERENQQEYYKRIRNLKLLRNEKQKGIEFELSADEHNSTWTLSFYGEHKAFNENLVLRKINWKTCFMYTWKEASKNQNDIATLNDDYLVDTAEVMVQRVEHGKGFFDNTKKKCFGESRLEVLRDYYDFYIGSFDKGKRHGSGMIMNESHIYIGEFKLDHYARGTKLYNDGDIASNFYFPSDCYNPYAQGSETGFGKIRFTDGGIFEGTMRNGEFTGKGIYISAIGERFEGKFHQGVLVEGLIRDSNGDERRGRFNEFGLLDGKGTWHSKAKRTSFDGNFINGEMRNGEEVFLNKRNEELCKYNGLWSVGDRCGIGSFSFRDRKFGFQNENSYFRMQCLWIAGCPSSGGMITNLQIDYRTPTTNHKSSDFKWLNRFPSVDRYKTKKAQRVDAEKRREDFVNRNRITSKKKNICNEIRSNIEVLIKFKEESTLDETFCTPRIMRIPPRSIEEAEACPGLQRMEYSDELNELIVPEETKLNSNVEKIWKALQHLERSWGTCATIT